MSNQAPVVAFFDVDGTLTWPKRNVGFRVFPSERVCSAIRAFVAAGNFAALSTGRGTGILGPLAELPFAGHVTLAGARAELDGRVVYEHMIAPEAVERAIEEMERVGMEAFLEGAFGPVRVGGRPGVPGDPFADVPTIDEHRAAGGPMEFGKIDFIAESLDALRQSAYLQEAFALVRTDGNNYELSAPGTSKARGARALLDALPFEPSRIYAFGDSGNDLDILGMADVAVAMGNASDEVKAIADYVTDDVCDDGVATALERLGLI